MDFTSTISQFYKKEIIQSHIEKIPPLTYAGFSNLERFTCSSCLKQIGDLAFVNCKSLEEIRFNESLEAIGKGAFGNCWSLKDLNLYPTKIKSFNTNVYTDNKALYYGYGQICNIVFPKTLERIEGIITNESCFEIPNPETEILIEPCVNNNEIIIIAPANSKAHEYAIAHKLTFVELTDGNPVNTTVYKTDDKQIGR